MCRDSFMMHLYVTRYYIYRHSWGATASVMNYLRIRVCVVSDKYVSWLLDAYKFDARLDIFTGTHWGLLHVRWMTHEYVTHYYIWVQPLSACILMMRLNVMYYNIYIQGATSRALNASWICATNDSWICVTNDSCICDLTCVEWLMDLCIMCHASFMMTQYVTHCYIYTGTHWKLPRLS